MKKNIFITWSLYCWYHKWDYWIKVGYNEIQGNWYTWAIIGENNPVLLRHGANVFLVSDWMMKTNNSFHLLFSHSQCILVLQSCWQCATWNTILFSNWSLSFNLFVNFIESLQHYVKRYWFMFASHCDIWLLMENYLYLNRKFAVYHMPQYTLKWYVSY